jgi:tetratricopeptide (TPR) repeat protein
MKKFTIPFLIIIIILLCNQCAKENKMIVTTNSETAITLYDEAMTASDDIYLSKFRKLMLEALIEDSDFFMANYRLARYYHWFENEEKFNEYGEAAVNCKAKLSKGELLLKDVISKLLMDSNADLTDLGKQLIKMYPNDVDAYSLLSLYQYMKEDAEGQLGTLKSMLEITDRPAPVYNMLGYVYMRLENNEEAEIAFDKYIEFEPNLPNPYDSKGDYFMKIEDYTNAYDMFIKANEIDSLWSFKKAMKAKAIADSLENM